jgi:hypothetical protein
MGINMHNELEPLAGVDTPALADFWKWVKKTFTFSYKGEIEAYLADSVDHADVENRIKRLQRRGMI